MTEFSVNNAMLTPDHYNVPYITIEGSSGVGKSTLIRRIPSEWARALPEYAHASRQIGRTIVNPPYPCNAKSQLKNEQYFACLELEYWHSKRGNLPLSAIDLFLGTLPIIRDRSFLGSVAFSFVCASFFGWGDAKDPLGSYRDLLTKNQIPCPTRIILLTAPQDLLIRRLAKSINHNPIWQDEALSKAIHIFLETLVDNIYAPWSLSTKDLSGFCTPYDIHDFVQYANKSFDSTLPKQVLRRLLAWEPPDLPMPSSYQINSLHRALSGLSEPSIISRYSIQTA